MTFVNGAGGFRPDLDLGEVMGHYSMWLQGTQTTNSGALPLTMDSPLIHGHGPATCSTETALAIVPEVCWDVQRYYSTLRVHWKASKKDLMRAYRDLGPMPSAWQTYAFKQLLDPAIRAEYDKWPLGVPFLHDMYVQDWLKRMAIKRAAQMSKQRGQEVSAEDVLSDWGMKMEPDEVVDTEDDGGQAALEAAEPASPPARSTPWLYAWFSWRSGKADTEVLRVWQESLVKVLSDQGERVQLAVGFAGRTQSRFVVAEVDGLRVVFLSDNEQPTSELAEVAAQALLRDMHQT